MEKVSDLARTAGDLLQGRSAVTIMTAMSPQEPVLAIRALLAEARRSRIPTTLLTACIDGRMAFLTDEDRLAIRHGLIRVVTIAGGAPAEISPFADALPYSLWNVDRMLRRGELDCDIYVVRATETPDRIDAGAAVGFTSTMLDREQTTTLVELETRGPAGLCDRELDWRRCLVWRSGRPGAAEHEEIARARPEKTDPARERIARLVSTLVPRDATVQLGIGALADEIARALPGGAHMGLHCGSLPEGALERIRRGAFERADGGADRGRQVATSLARAPRGGERLPASISLRPIESTHSPDALANVQRLWAVNSALDVDLFGQPNSEWLGGRRVASAGGLADFTRGAHLSPGGASVLALPARTASGRARIRSTLASPSVVSAPAAEIDFLVTEHGIAELRGLTRSHRAEAIIGVAHPGDRRALEAEAAAGT